MLSWDKASSNTYRVQHNVSFSTLLEALDKKSKLNDDALIHHY